MKNFNLPWAVGTFLFVVLFVTATQMITLPIEEVKEWKVSGAPCVGEAIEVDYPYEGEMLKPHACAKQCEGEVQYYILYEDGQATQCDDLPDCNDWGEDYGITCLPQ